MAFTGTFSVSQSSDGLSLSITDTSSYSGEPQVTFSSRRVFLYRIDGTTVVPDGTSTAYIDWPFGVGSILTISDILARSISLTIEVDWISNDPQLGSTYVASDVKSFTFDIEDFAYGKLQQLAANPKLRNDTNWSNAFDSINNEILNTERATARDDQFSAQSAIERFYDYVRNENKYF